MAAGLSVGVPSAALFVWVCIQSAPLHWAVLVVLWLLWTAAAALLARRALQALPPRPALQAAPDASARVPPPLEWLAGVAHTLRNRLGALAGASEVLALEFAEPVVRARARVIVAQQLQAATQLVADLADPTPAVLPAITAQRLDLAAVAVPLLDAQRAGAVAAGQLLLQVLQPAPVLADAALLARAVRGLLRHALRRLRDGGTVVLRVHAQAPHAVLSLLALGDDERIALDADAALAPFVPDLDCALAQRIVALHGGALVVDAAGAIRIQLPLAAPPDSAAAVRRTTPQHIVLAEGLDLVGETVADMLRRDGHSVSMHADASAGLRHMLSERPDATVLDLHLPGTSGLVLASHARHCGYAGRMVAISGYGALHDRVDALRSGFDALPARPLHPGLLRKALVKPHESKHNRLQNRSCDA